MENTIHHILNKLSVQITINNNKIIIQNQFKNTFQSKRNRENNEEDYKLALIRNTVFFEELKKYNQYLFSQELCKGKFSSEDQFIAKIKNKENYLKDNKDSLVLEPYILELEQLWNKSKESSWIKYLEFKYSYESMYLNIMNNLACILIEKNINQFDKGEPPPALELFLLTKNNQVIAMAIIDWLFLKTSNTNFSGWINSLNILNFYIDMIIRYTLDAPLECPTWLIPLDANSDLCNLYDLKII